ncbi:bifunctional diguanylate cyclase/phosphodiesterase [Shewanella sp. VB17]|uniref:putative bifunctional diguanylate cyclase/phosphodiesterase n=1 Tax=Shewanella sp. VB17 TaxID=2739432 RepID=UPI0015638DF4|nr:bifunctional diguanylate cyclase/phosphodiesterase [Shewanella sp. VB17]NRD74216.1 bifunctional diguanylate cyclase/phosphodiesterase [Shewanella sp. VB17]
MTSLINNVLNAMQQIIIEVVDSSAGTARIIEGESQWSNDLFPHSQHRKIFNIDDNFPFLQDFLIDAELVWTDTKNGKVRSGFWTEVIGDNQKVHLEAIAIKQEQHNLLVISNLSEEFIIRQNTMQSARDLVLHHDRLVETNEYLHTRLLAILNKPTEQNGILVALTKAIENTGFSVLIAESNFNTIITNTTALSLFEQDKPSDDKHTNPMAVIVQLLKNQVPEYERIISTKSSWDGELCWMSPPSTLKWLKVSLYPVLGELNEVKNWLVFANDISNTKHLVQVNEQLGLQDMLTELPNRIAFWQTLEKQVALNIPFYLLYVDINEFRRHNEFYGHDEGDKLLIELSVRLKNTMQASDFIARVGGDEFAIILNNINSQQACKHEVNKIFNAMKKDFETTKSGTFNICLSIGAASFPHDTLCVKELMKFVDLSAYNGKEVKANSLQFYSQSMQDASHQLIELENELRLAIKNNEFELFLQPIVDLERNKVVKAEALIRWNHSTKGMIFPDVFIPVAEKSGLIIMLGKWVIDRACQIAKEINGMGYELRISINLSPSQVFDINLFSDLHACVKHYNIDPGLLELEITEGVLVDDYSIIEQLLNKVRALGMSVSIDDFGTGYSSLAYLKKLPVDILKIDQSFIRDIVNDDNDKAIVKAIISMAHNLNLGVIAEGVETKEQLSFLHKNDCNAVQGYLFSKPAEFDKFIAYLKDEKNGIVQIH